MIASLGDARAASRARSASARSHRARRAAARRTSDRRARAARRSRRRCPCRRACRTRRACADGSPSRPASSASARAACGLCATSSTIDRPPGQHLEAARAASTFDERRRAPRPHRPEGASRKSVERGERGRRIARAGTAPRSAGNGRPKRAPPGPRNRHCAPSRRRSRSRGRCAAAARRSRAACSSSDARRIGVGANRGLPGAEDAGLLAPDVLARGAEIVDVVEVDARDAPRRRHRRC